MENVEAAVTTRREESDRELESVASAGSTVEALGGAAGVVLAILGLASVEPDYMLAVAAVIIGGTLVAQAALTASEYTDIMTKLGAGMWLRTGFESEMGAEALAGGAAMVLGVLAILGIHPVVLGAIAAIVLGTGFLMNSGVSSRLNSLDLEASGHHELARKLARTVASGSIGAQVLVGIGAVILGILGLVGFNAQVLVLAALLILGASALLSGGALGGKMASLLAH